MTERAKSPPASDRGGKTPSQRQLRVGEEIRHALAAVFARGDIRDPDLAGEAVTVTEVRVSPDLKNATAFVARLGRPDVDVLLPALKRVAPFLRREVAHAVRLRVAPTLSFQPDTALDYAMHVDALLRSPAVARRQDAAPPAPRPEKVKTKARPPTRSTARARFGA